MDAPERRLFHWLCQVGEVLPNFAGETGARGDDTGAGRALDHTLGLARAERWYRAIDPPIREVEVPTEGDLWVVLESSR